MDHAALLIVVLQLCGTNVEGKFVDSTVKLTEKVKLECIYPKKATIIQTSWTKLNVTHKENIAVLHPIYGVHIEDKYNGRIYFENTSREDQSLSFIKSTLEDVGRYFCSIVTYPDGIWEKVIEIIQPADAFEVSEKQNNLVFTKPGGNVAFTCPYKIGDSVQQVMWERIKGDRVDTIVLCNSSGKQSFGSDFKERTLVDCSDPANSMMVIQNITASDFATYRCVATGRKKTYVMSFTVAGTWDHKRFIIYIAGGISAAVLLLVFLLIFCITTAYHKKKKRKRITEALSKALYWAQTQPANSYGTSSFHGTWNTERRGEESSLGKTEEIYVNCKNVSHKPKTRPLDSFGNERTCLDLKVIPAVLMLHLESETFQRLQWESVGCGKDLKTLRVKTGRPAGGGG
ncbi:CD226 antigen [Gymnogyps californianus]|uniref:CD226 antigen n=1 Tax=Gymnogyps californianus TaxID=33616 RepID=UPI0021C86B16|nr:CD226 antigen [Gymnogyps californianus]